MSTSVFPTLAGLGFDVIRTPIWSNTIQESVSGKETAIGNWSYPKWQWELTFDVLRSDADTHEFQDLAGFFNLRHGRFDTFLYEDAEDNSVTGQSIGTGDGDTTTFQLIRTFGNFIEPVFAPHTVSNVYLDGSDGGGWSVSNWGTSTPGLITFDTAPDDGAAITADFSFYFPCRFNDDRMSFTNFMKRLWNAQSVAFTSVK